MSMNWWWRGDIGASWRRQDEVEHAAATERRPFQSVALVVGCTGIVGASLVDILPRPDTPGGPWKVYALSRRPLPPWWQQQHPPSSSSSSATVVTHLQVDLADSAAVVASLAPLTDITHVFYAALSPPSGTAEAKNPPDANSAMLRRVLAAVVPNCPKLRHVCLQTGTKHYMGPPASVGRRTAAHDPPYTEDMPRLDWRNFYYDQEDVLFDAVAKSPNGGAAVTWSVHRPSLVFGFSPRSAMNIVCSLCVYAAICRKEGVPLQWPGSLGAWEGFSNASDADLVAEQQIWAAVVDHPMAKNEAFNCSNGDVFTWRLLWPVLARRFRMEWAGYRGEGNQIKLADAMAGKGAVWAEIVEESQLVPTQLHEVANWWFVDALFFDKWEFLDSMNKSKEHGFLGFRNTAKSFNAWIDKMKAYKIVP